MSTKTYEISSHGSEVRLLWSTVALVNQGCELSKGEQRIPHFLGKGVTSLSAD